MKTLAPNKLQYLFWLILVFTLVDAFVQMHISSNYYLYSSIGDLGLLGLTIDIYSLQWILHYNYLHVISSNIIVFILVLFSLYFFKKGRTTFATAFFLFLLANFFIAVWGGLIVIFIYKEHFWGVLNTLVQLVYGCLILYLIYALNKGKRLNTSEKVTSRFHRAFNLIFDTCLLYFIGTILVETSEDILTIMLLGLFVYLLYYTLCEYFFGFTFGKLITGTRVVQNDGSPLTFEQSLNRSIIRLVPVDIFTFIPSISGWHDSRTSTKVVVVEKTMNKWYYYVIAILMIIVTIMGSILFESYLEAV